ncbi:MAG: pentapeptide repeat-containing protein [Cyanobacteriota bacterium]
MSEGYENNITIQPAIQKNKKTLKLDFFIDLKVRFEDLFRVISLINILALLATKNVELEEVPEFFYTHIETDSILFTFESSDVFFERFKEIIIDINKIKHNDNMPDGHYLMPLFYKLFQHTKEGISSIDKYILLKDIHVTSIDDYNEFIFKWTRKLTAINGKSIEEKPIYETKEEVIEAYFANKDNLSNSIFSELNLSGLEIPESNLKDSEFIKSNLMKASLEFSNLENTDFTDANLIGASLANTNMFRSNLSRAQLMECNLSESNLKYADLSGAFLIGANMRRADLSNANLAAIVLARADTSRAKLINCNAKGSNLVGINAVEANLSDSDFSNSDLTTARLQGVNITGTNFANSKLLETNLSGILNYNNSNFISSDWWNASEISDQLLYYLRSIFPCSQDEIERKVEYKLKYGKEISNESFNKQNYFLGLSKKIVSEIIPENVSENKSSSNESIDDIFNKAELTPEDIEKLAMEGWNDPT